MTIWLRHQTTALRHALARLVGQPVSTLLTALAMGVAISLPAGLYLGLDSVRQLAGDLPAQPEISLFLDNGISPGARKALEVRLTQPDIAHARFLSRDDALAHLGADPTLRDVISSFSENPLPDAWVVQPRDTDPARLSALAEALGRHAGVAETHVDSQWAAKLAALLSLGHTLVGLLTALFAIALAAIAGNAIRAQVLARRDEILVSRLIGATNRHIRRPFLYTGALQGLAGGLAALGVLATAGLLLRGALIDLAQLYGTGFQLGWPGLPILAAILGLPAVFGWLGAWLSVARSLKQVESAN